MLTLLVSIAVTSHKVHAESDGITRCTLHLRGYHGRQAVDKAGRTRDLLARHGIDCPTVTGAGTGSFEFETASGVYTELQCGSYIFMDADYGRNRDRDGAPTKAFEPSLFVWATVMSRPAEDRAIYSARYPTQSGRISCCRTKPLSRVLDTDRRSIQH